MDGSSGNWRTASCWDCTKKYAFKRRSCPHCGAANANVDWQKAKRQEAEKRELLELIAPDEPT